jgi:gas vesicle protein
MNHYTYFLTAKEPFNGMKYYIGVRSCKNSPEEDKYLGSSRVIKRNKIAVDKHILATWDSRKKAVSHEILLHDCFNVAVNKEFFNQALQTAVGFDTSGMLSPMKGKKHTTETIDKMRESKLNQSFETRQKISNTLKGHVAWNKNISPTDDAKYKMSQAKLGKICSVEHRLNISKAKSNISEETRKKLSDSAKRYWEQKQMKELNNV